MTTATDTEIGDFTDDEIKAEYTERFGDPDDYNLSDFSSSDMIEELETRDAMPEPDGPADLNEIADLIAEAARTSKHALRAYGLMMDAYPEIGQIAARQMLIVGRMDEAA